MTCRQIIILRTVFAVLAVFASTGLFADLRWRYDLINPQIWCLSEFWIVLIKCGWFLTILCHLRCCNRLPLVLWPHSPRVLNRLSFDRCSLVLDVVYFSENIIYLLHVYCFLLDFYHCALFMFGWLWWHVIHVWIVIFYSISRFHFAKRVTVVLAIEFLLKSVCLDLVFEIIIFYLIYCFFHWVQNRFP